MTHNWKIKKQNFFLFAKQKFPAKVSTIYTGLKFNLLFSKLLSIQTRSLKKYFQIYRQARLGSLLSILG
jgi:hypothetical protein